MHHAVLAKKMNLVRLLEEYDGDARIKNSAEMSPIDLTLIENIKDIKLLFMSSSKYANETFTL